MSECQWCESGKLGLHSHDKALCPVCLKALERESAEGVETSKCAGCGYTETHVITLTKGSLKG